MSLSVTVISMNILIIIFIINMKKVNIILNKYLSYLIYFVTFSNIVIELPMLIKSFYPNLVYNYSLSNQISDAITSGIILLLVIILYSINIIIISVSKHTEELIKKYLKTLD